MNTQMRDLNRGSAATSGWPSSWMYVPANRVDLFEKAVESQAGAIILDLEDAVPLSHKDSSRALIREWLTQKYSSDSPGVINGKQIWARINANDVSRDLTALFGDDETPLCVGTILAKAEVGPLYELVESSEGKLPVVGLVESAVGLRNIDRMVDSSSVITFGIGEVDLLADLRVKKSRCTQSTIDSIRLEVVMACAAGGLRAPIGPTSTDFHNMGAFEADTRKLSEQGFRARTAIHPKQNAVINRVFSPSTEEVQAAEEIVARFREASGGVTVGEDGHLLDAAVVRSAREVLERAPESEAAPPKDHI